MIHVIESLCLNGDYEGAIKSARQLMDDGSITGIRYLMYIHQTYDFTFGDIYFEYLKNAADNPLNVDRIQDSYFYGLCHCPFNGGEGLFMEDFKYSHESKGIAQHYLEYALSGGHVLAPYTVAYAHLHGYFTTPVNIDKALEILHVLYAKKEAPGPYYVGLLIIRCHEAQQNNYLKGCMLLRMQTLQLEPDDYNHIQIQLRELTNCVPYGQWEPTTLCNYFVPSNIRDQLFTWLLCAKFKLHIPKYINIMICSFIVTE